MAFANWKCRNAARPEAPATVAELSREVIVIRNAAGWLRYHNRFEDAEALVQAALTTERKAREAERQLVIRESFRKVDESKARAERDALAAQVAALREELGYYADPANCRRGVFGSASRNGNRNTWERDEGSRARAALSASETGGGDV